MPDKNPVFKTSRHVEFHETDAAGVVHFTSIFRWMEAAEHAFLRDMGVPVLEKDSGWPRASVCASFHAPIRFGDEVEIRVWARVRNSSRVNFYFEVWRMNEAGAPQKCASGEFTTVHVRFAKGKFQPAPLPTPVVAKLKRITSR